LGQLTDGDDDSNTPLTEDAARGLIPSWVATRGDLNDIEAENVAAGILWLDKTHIPIADQLTAHFVSKLHQRLFGDVWKWAGKYRTVNLNIGVDWHAITTEIKQLVDDFAYRLDGLRRPTSGTELDAECVEYHYRLVTVHPFPNGNGRHSRVSADALCMALGQDPFSWGQGSIGEASQTRSAYLQALRKADDGDLEPLVRFARS
jgi:Fic-DOC domain mobile mystery protein B